MKKRNFIITPGIYGGEFVMGTVSSDFVLYWEDKDEYDLSSHISSLIDSNSKGDPESPPIFDNPDKKINDFTDLNDLAHVAAAYGGGYFFVCEDLGDSKLGETIEFEPKFVTCCNIYLAELDEEKDFYEKNELIPVVIFSMEKKRGGWRVVFRNKWGRF